MYSIVALVACIGVTAASKCCIPPQWEATTSFLTTIDRNGKLYTASGTILMAYDNVNKKIGQYEFISMGNIQQLSYGVLLDYNTKMKYTINEKGLCYKTALNRDISEFGGCIPDNATLLGNGPDVMGLSSNSMRMNSYLMGYEGVSAVIGVTADGCIPVMETISGTIEGNNFIQNLHFFNITGGIADPTNLQVPPRGCENAVPFEGHYTSGNFLAGGIGRRSVFLGL